MNNITNSFLSLNRLNSIFINIINNVSNKIQNNGK